MKKLLFNLVIIAILIASFIVPVVAIFYIGWYALFLTLLPTLTFHLVAYIYDNEEKIVKAIKVALMEWSNAQPYYNNL